MIILIFNHILIYILYVIDILVLLNDVGMTAVSVPFELGSPIHSIWKNFTLISGSVATGDLGLHDNTGTNLTFSFSLMQSQNKICLNLYHYPSVSLPRVVNNCNPLQYNLVPQSTGAFVLPSEGKRSSASTQCPENATFDLKLKENADWTVYLNKVNEI